MKKRYTQQSAKRFIEELESVTAETAKNFFFSHGYNSSSFEMPEYYVPGSLAKIKLDPINNWKDRPPRITRSLSFLTPKGFLGWRSFSFLHPYIYIHIVQEITEHESWTKLVEILAKETLVYCYSTPGFVAEKDSITKKQAIDRWVLMAEKDIVKDCVDYSFLTTTDIKNFYASIYTHSIAWAIEGRETIRNGNRKNYYLLGNRLDKLFQNANDGQTNGIPVGSMVSDFIAEIILKRVDELLSTWIDEEAISENVIVARYRDDYRILSHSEEEGRRVLKRLGRILNTEYNLILNEDKTNVFNDILEGTIRDWSSEINDDFLLRQVKYEQMDMEVSFSYLKDILLKTYKTQKKYKNGRPSITLLSKLITHLGNKDVTFEIDESGVQTLVSVLRKISLLREEASAQIFILLDILLKKLSKDIKKELIIQMLKTIEGEKDYTYQVIWLYRLCLSHHPDMCGYILLDSSPLLEILDEEYTREPGRSDIEVFEPVEDLEEVDIQELKKFSLVSDGILKDALNKEINKEVFALFSYRNK